MLWKRMMNNSKYLDHKIVRLLTTIFHFLNSKTQFLYFKFRISKSYTFSLFKKNLKKQKNNHFSLDIQYSIDICCVRRKDWVKVTYRKNGITQKLRYKKCPSVYPRGKLQVQVVFTLKPIFPIEFKFFIFAILCFSVGLYT